MHFDFPVSFDQDTLRQYREELAWTNQEIEMLAIALEREPKELSNVERLRQILQESLMDAVKLDLVPLSESLADTIKGIDLLLDWQFYPPQMTEFVLLLLDKLMIIGSEIEERHIIDMRKTQAILVALQHIILAKSIDEMSLGVERAIEAITQETHTEQTSSDNMDIDLFDDFSDEDPLTETGEDQNANIDIFVPEAQCNPLSQARDFIKQSGLDHYMQLIEHIDDNEIQHTRAHTHFVLELALATNFAAGEVADSINLLKGICLHDIALASMAHQVQNKAVLTEDEREDIYMHPVLGAELAYHMDASDETLDLILHHHEHVDGSGYPHGIKGSNMSEAAKLASIVDAFHNTLERFRYLTPKKQLLRGVYEVNSKASSKFDSIWVYHFNKALEKCWLPEWNNRHRL